METCQQELSKLEVQHTVLASRLLSCRNANCLQKPAPCVCQAVAELQGVERNPTQKIKKQRKISENRSTKKEFVVGKADL